MAAEKDVFSVLSQAARAGAGAAPAPRSRKRKSGTPPPPRPPREGSSFAVCPLCGGSVALALADAHARECDGGVSGSQPALAPAAPPPPPWRSPTPDADDDDAAPSTTAARPSVLAELMRAGRDASRIHCFYAERREGLWFWHWFDCARPPQGLPPPAWSADIALALPPPGGTARGGKPRGGGPKTTVRLATNVPPDAAAARAAGPPPPPGFGASLLKSALQKNVRLGRVVAAAAVAAALARLDVGELARRLPIILIEDAILHPALPHAVWVMAAIGKGYAPPRASISTLIRLAAAAAASPVRDDPAAWPPVEDEPQLVDALDGLFSGGGGGGGGNSGAESAAAALAASGDTGALLLTRCLYFRAAYGGMPCDVRMMDAAARVWAARLAGVAPPPPRAMKNGAPTAAPPLTTWQAYVAATAASAPGPLPADPSARLTPADLPLSAVDFHVSSISDDLLLVPEIAAEAAAVAVGQGDRREDAKAALERAMWVFRSGRNARPRVEPLPPSDEAAQRDERDALRPLWRVARGPADAWSADYIKTRMMMGG